MNWTRLHTDHHALVELHFARRLSTRLHRRMWRHLEGCDSCRQLYRAYALLEALEPDAQTQAQRRLAPPALMSPPAEVLKRRNTLWLSLAAAISVGVIVLASSQPSPTPREFSVRGSSLAEGLAPSIAVYRVPSSQGTGNVPQAHARADDHVLAGEGLAFSYLLPKETEYSSLMIFAVDAAGRISWFWPAWQNEREDPRSVAIHASPHPVELGEAIFHDYQSGRLQLYALFSQRPYSVKEVETLLVQSGPQALRSAGNHLWSHSLEVQL